LRQLRINFRDEKNTLTLNLGADINATDQFGQTPLIIACQSFHYSHNCFAIQCCKTLLELGANPNHVDLHGNTALNITQSNVTVADMLIKNGASLFTGEVPVIISAIVKGNVPLLRICLENGVDLNIPMRTKSNEKDQMLKYPLCIAVEATNERFTNSYPITKTRLEVIKLLLEYGANVDIPWDDNTAFIHHVFAAYRIEVFEQFMKLGFDPNMRDQQGRTVFLAACSSKLELKIGSRSFSLDETEKQVTPETPSYLSLADSNVFGPKIDYLATDDEGVNALMLLALKWKKPISDRFLGIPGFKELAKTKDKRGYKAIHYALRSRSVVAIRQFIKDCDADILEPDPKGNTILHSPFVLHKAKVCEDWLPLIQTYLQLGGSINARDNKGYTPFLKYISNTIIPEILEEDIYFSFFISNGADIHATTNNGETALHIVARRSSWIGHFGRRYLESDNESLREQAMFKKLVEHGLDPLQEDKNGATALDIAAVCGKDAILALYERKK
jgi:ankyrin repeat protein